MEDSKYYTPTIEEFHVGFEYETIHGSSYWVKEISDGSEIYHISKYYLPKEEIRVKYLDREDIESLGWKFQAKSIDEWFYWSEQIRLASGHYMHFRMQYGYHDNRMRIFAQEYENANEETFFEGTIKNKSELKTLMRWLGIKE